MNFLTRFVYFLKVLTLSFLGACSTHQDHLRGIEHNLPLHSKLQILVDDAFASGHPGVSLYVKAQNNGISVMSGEVNKAIGEKVTPWTLFLKASFGKPLLAVPICAS